LASKPQAQKLMENAGRQPRDIVARFLARRRICEDHHDYFPVGLPEMSEPLPAPEPFVAVPVRGEAEPFWMAS
jgi:hypothetical protein